MVPGALLLFAAAVRRPCSGYYRNDTVIHSPTASFCVSQTQAHLCVFLVRNGSLDAPLDQPPNAKKPEDGTF